MIVLLFLLLPLQPALALKLEPNKWHDFDGTFGEAAVRISLFVLPGNELKGSYCNKKFDVPIQLKGKMSGDVVELTEFQGGQPHGFFKGEVFTNDKDRFEGTWTDKAGTKTLEFKTTISSIVAGTANKRYDLLGTDAAVENFVKRLKTSIIKGNREWVAAHIQYPMRARTVDGKNIVIQKDSQLIKEFDRIFHEEFKERIKSVCACGMFSNFEGVSLGDGIMWIANSQGSEGRKFDFVVISINN